MNRPRRVISVRMSPQSPVNWVWSQKFPVTVPGSPNTGPLLKKGSKPGAKLASDASSVGTGPHSSNGVGDRGSDTLPNPLKCSPACEPAAVMSRAVTVARLKRLAFLLLRAVPAKSRACSDKTFAQLALSLLEVSSVFVTSSALIIG